MEQKIIYDVIGSVLCELSKMFMAIIIQHRHSCRMICVLNMVENKFKMTNVFVEPKIAITTENIENSVNS